MGARLHYVDWLRVGAIAGIFVFHTTRAFDTTSWHVKNVETSVVFTDVQFFFATFGIPMLFLLAGAGVRFALRRRSPALFLRERTARLLVPFVAGTVALSPIQAYLEASNHGTAPGAFTDFASRWFVSAFDAVIARGFSPTVFGAVGYHLWFLGFLFAISVLALPLCMALLTPRGVRAMRGLASRSSLPGSSLVFAVPIALFIGGFAPFGTDEHDWFEFGWYLAYFMIGFVLVSDDRFMDAVRRDRGVALVTAILATAAVAYVDIGTWASTLDERGIDWTYPAMGILFATMGWAWSLVVLNVGLATAQLQRPVPQRVGDAVLPVYLLHQPVILAVAFFVVQWPTGIALKWLAVFAVSLPVTVALVEPALRAPVLRLLLGARVRAPAPLPAPA
jgi:peptidoglycan/LPS O-acetylase OafA/YrhL